MSFLASNFLSAVSFAIRSPRVMASYRLTFGASLIAAMVNAVLGLLVAWVLVRYPFPGRRFFDALYFRTVPEALEPQPYETRRVLGSPGPGPGSPGRRSRRCHWTANCWSAPDATSKMHRATACRSSHSGRIMTTCRSPRKIIPP